LNLAQGRHFFQIWRCQCLITKDSRMSGGHAKDGIFWDLTISSKDRKYTTLGYRNPSCDRRIVSWWWTSGPLVVM
jgi:hypothetical protein